MDNYKIIFPQRLKELRAAKGLSQDELAQKVNVLRAAIGHWENGRREPDIKTLCALADLFKVPLDYMIGRSDDPTPLNQASRRARK